MGVRGLGVSHTIPDRAQERERAVLNLSSWNVGLAFHKAIQGADMRWWP